MRKYPFIKQEGIRDCGVACLAMIIKYYDGYVSFDKLRILTKTSRDGVNAYDLCEGAKEVGFEAYGVKMDLESFRNNQTILPCIAHVNINGTLHYIVIYSIDYSKQKIIVADPSDKLKKISFNEFKNIWDGIILNLYPIRKIPLEKQCSFVKTIFEILKPHSKLLLNILLFSLLSIIFSCLSSFYFKILIDSVNTSKNYIFLIFVIFLVINIVKLLNSFFRNKLIIYFNQKLDMNLSVNIYNRIIELPYQYYRNRTTGEIVSRFNDLNLVKEIISRLLLQLFADLPLILISFVLLCLIDIYLGLISGIILFVYLIINFIFKPFINKYIDKIQRDKDLNTSIIVETINGFETVKNLNIINYFKIKFKSKYYNFLNKMFVFDSILNIKQFLNDFIFEIGMIIILFLGTFKIFDDSMTVGSLVMFYSLFNYYIESGKNLLNLDVSYKEAKTALKRIVEIFEDENDQGIVEKLNNSSINYHQLTYSYNDRFLALDNINLKIKRGEKILITGSSGSGKSTLLKLLMRYYKTDNNKIFIDNIDINYYKEETIKRNIVYISQNETLFSDNIINNLCLGENKNVSEIIRMCEIDNILNKRNLNLNYIIEENGFNFSGGEKQRIILARALNRKFKILLIDEGLNQMDVDLERRILKRVFNKYKNEIIIVISHRRDNLDLYDRNIEMCKGRIVKDVRRNT